MGTVAFICAMPMELRPLSRRLRLRRDEVGGRPARTGVLGDRRVVAIVTGMGTARAAAATDQLLTAITPDRVVVVGITGAVEDETPIGTLVVPEVVIDGATGRRHRPEPLAPGPASGTMWTTDLLTPPEALPALRRQGVVSLDMETAAIAQCCEARGIAWSVFRAISDRASDGSVDAEIFQLSNPDGTPNVPAVARYVVRHPLRLARMASLARGAKLATERAATAAIDAVLAAG